MGCIQSTEQHVEPVTDILGNERTLPVRGPDSIMDRKSHGSSNTPVQYGLKYGCDYKTADRICNYNRHFAEHEGYFRTGLRKTAFLGAIEEAKGKDDQITFYDSNTGKSLFTAPVGRSWDAWLAESKSHGWPSFRDAEVNWDNVRCLRNGESVSTHGTHLGHNIPDRTGNRYCINLVSIAGNHVADPKPEAAPVEEQAAGESEVEVTA